MIDSYYREAYQKSCVKPILPLFKRVSPKSVTILSLFFGLFASPLIAFGYSWTAFLFLLTSGYLDTLDGSLARYLKKTSSKGAALDIVSDRLVEFSIVLGLFFVAPSERALPSIVMLGSILLCVTTFLVVGIFTENQSAKSFHYSPGVMERTEAFIFFALMILLPTTFTYLAYLFSFLTFFTAFRRLWQFQRDQE